MTVISDGLPVEIYALVISELGDRDLHAASLVNLTFNRIATRFLYRTWDSRLKKGAYGRLTLLHPANTLLRKPELAHHVLHVRESGDDYFEASVYSVGADSMCENSLRALALCTNLTSFTWTGDTSAHEALFLAFVEVLPSLRRLRTLNIRTSGSLSDRAWSALKRLSALTHVSLWAMEGPPRFLQGWAPALGPTLTHLELGRCAGVPATLLGAALSALPQLRTLRIKGVPGAAILALIGVLPHLEALDTDYTAVGPYRHWQDTPPPPPLRSLTVRASSMDVSGPQHLWSWVSSIVPGADEEERGTNMLDGALVERSPPPERGGQAAPRGLEEFTLYAYTVQGLPLLPHAFVVFLGRHHRTTLRRFLVGTTQLNLPEAEFLCAEFPALEELGCSIGLADADTIARTLAKARNLKTAWLHVNWVPHPQSAFASSAPSPHVTPGSLRDSTPSTRITPRPTFTPSPSGSFIARPQSPPFSPSPSPSPPPAMRSGAPPAKHGIDAETHPDEPLSPESSMSPPTRYDDVSARTTLAAKGTTLSARATDAQFSVADARRIMLGAAGDREGAEPATKLRVLAIGPVVYTGRWVLKRRSRAQSPAGDPDKSNQARDETETVFEVERNVDIDEQNRRALTDENTSLQRWATLLASEL